VAGAVNEAVGAVVDQAPAELRDALASFSVAARRLEVRYAELKERAAAIDLELHQSNAALQGALAERERLLAALPLGVVAFDARGRIVWRNELSARLLGDAGGEVAQWPDGERDVGDRVLSVRRASMADGGVLVLLEDRSQVAHLQREVDRLDRLAGLSELALGIAHEIKNPLNGACGFAALLQRGGEAADLQRYAQRVGEGLAQVDRIVRELLAFARPAPAARRPMALAAVVDEAAHAAGVARTRIVVRGTFDELVEGAALCRVLTNLVRNAADAAGDALRVQIDARCAADDKLAIIVRDNGPGVPPALAARLFQPFVTDKPRGHGLGLALAARVLSFLHGSLRLLNAGEPGAAFEVIVPRLPAETKGGG
jgi:signal transduction histidine kinase